MLIDFLPFEPPLRLICCHGCHMVVTILSHSCYNLGNKLTSDGLNEVTATCGCGQSVNQGTVHLYYTGRKRLNNKMMTVS